MSLMWLLTREWHHVSHLQRIKHIIYQTAVLHIHHVCFLTSLLKNSSIHRYRYLILVPGSSSTVGTEAPMSSGLFPRHQSSQGGGRSRLHVLAVFPDQGVSASTAQRHLTGNTEKMVDVGWTLTWKLDLKSSRHFDFYW